MTSIADVFVSVHADVDGLGGEIEQGAAVPVQKAGRTLSQRFGAAFKNPAVLNNLGVAAGTILGTAVGRGAGAILNGSAADNLGRFSGNIGALGGGLAVVGVSAGALGTVAAAAEGLSGASDLLAMSTSTLTGVKGFFIATTNAETGAVTASTLSRIRATVATYAQRAATLAATVATRAAAAGQWLLNAALTANPIGLVVAAVALLVGGFVLAYKKSDTFRGIVNKLWETLKRFVGFTPLGALIKNFGAIRVVVGVIIDKIKTLIKKLKDLPGVDKLGAIAGLAGKLPGFVRSGGFSDSFGSAMANMKFDPNRRLDTSRVYIDDPVRRMAANEQRRRRYTAHSRTSGGVTVNIENLNAGPGDVGIQPLTRKLTNLNFTLGLA